MTIKEKLAQAQSNVPKVYEAGIDEGKSLFGIPNEVTGTGIVTCDYVNENEHNVDVKLSSDTVTDFSGVEVKAIRKNVYSGGDINGTNSENVYLDVKISVGTYTISANVSSSDTNYTACKVSFRESDTDEICSTLLSRGNRMFSTITLAADCNVIRFYASNTAGNSTDDTFSFTDIQIERLNVATDYEPHTVKTYTANADGTVDGVTSISPIMNLFCDTDGMDITAKYYQCPTVEYDKFWDGMQNYGQSANYNFAFSGYRWSKNTFKPKYDFVAKSVYNMFRYSDMLNIREYLEEANVKIDLSMCTLLDEMFTHSNTKETPVLDLSTINSMKNSFRYCYFLERIELLNIRKDCTYGETFTQCPKLVEFRCTGTIGNNFGFLQSSLLSNESVQNVIDCLVDLTGETAKKLFFHTNVILRLTDEQITQITDKNWQIA